MLSPKAARARNFGPNLPDKVVTPLVDKVRLRYLAVGQLSLASIVKYGTKRPTTLKTSVNHVPR
jgi:hypothetical protein